MGKNATKRRKLNAKKDDNLDDKIIKSLEKKLRLKNKKKPSKSLPKSFVCDGLDYILEVCDEDTRKVAAESEKQLLVQSDDEIDITDDSKAGAAKSKVRKNIDLGKKVKKISTKEPLEQSFSESDYDSEIDGESEIEDEEKDLKTFKKTNQNLLSKKEETCLTKKRSASYVEDEIESNKFSSAKNKKQKKLKTSSKDLKNSKATQKKEELSDCAIDEVNTDSSNKLDVNSESDDNNCKEDIYGRLVSRDGKIVSKDKYISPALRAKNIENNSENNQKLLLLRRQLKGLLNRLAESNMHSIINQLDDMYMSHSRNSMNEMLSTLMLESIVAPVLTADRLVTEHMMCIAILHANVGVEVGAHFVMTLVKKFNEMIQQNQEVENKELDNLVLMISQLYNFKVFGSNLIYQIIEKLMEKFSEKEIEIILLILKSAGFRMRKDDPLALKELILKIQKKAVSTKSSNSRIQFMLEILLAIKNNNMNKIPQYDQSYVEHLKKISKTLIRKGNTVSQLNLTLQDLLNADEQGRWWIVGSAWSGNLPQGNKSEKISEPVYSEKILKLAKTQRMNSDVRKNIFCILMTAEDYLDAFERLHHLSLKNRQEREIIYVILNCCLQEKKYNPFYSVLLQKFCEYERKYQMTIQYALWDKLKMLNEYANFQILNMAKLMSHLFIQKALPLSILRVIELGELDSFTMKLIKEIMLNILLHENTDTCLQVFTRIAPSEKLHQFKEGMRLFINYFLLKNMKKESLPEKQWQLLEKRVELADRILTTSMSKVSF